MPPEKERKYRKQIDELKLEVSELRAENYQLGEKFIARDLKDKDYRLRIEEKEIESQEKEIQLSKLKDSMNDSKNQFQRLLDENRELKRRHDDRDGKLE